MTWFTASSVQPSSTVSIDNEIGGTEEFVGLDRISVAEENFVFITEATRSAFGQAKKQVLLPMKGARDNNGESTMYGFVTTGERWQMLSYDSSGFCLSRKMTAVLPEWMRTRDCG